MMPCLVIRLPLPRPAATARHMPAAIRRTTSAPPPTQERPLDAATSAPALEFLREVGMALAAAEAALSAAGTAATAATIEATCLELVDVAKIPVQRLGEVLTAAPELLSLPPGGVRSAYSGLSQAWPDERKLQRAVLDCPQMLLPSYPTDLRRCMTTLAGLGMTNAQTAAALVRCPRLAGLRRYEVAAALAKCGIPAKIEDEAMLEFLARFPWVLTPQGTPRLAAALEEIRKALGVTPAEAQFIVSRAKAVLDRDITSFREVVSQLRGFGLTAAQVAAAAKAWPTLLTRRPERVRLALKVLGEAGVEPDRVAGYPQIFARDALRTLGPRLAFARSRGGLVLKAPLRDLMNCSDEDFASLVSDLAPGPGGSGSSGGGGLTAADYEGFRISWLAGQQLQAEGDAEDDADDSSGSDGERNRPAKARQQQQQQKKAAPRFYAPRQPQRRPQGQQKQLQRLTPQQRVQKQQQKVTGSAPSPRTPNP